MEMGYTSWTVGNCPCMTAAASKLPKLQTELDAVISFTCLVLRGYQSVLY